MSKSEGLSKSREQGELGSRSELLLAFLVVGYDLAVTPVLEIIGKQIDKVRGRIEREITTGTLPDD